MDVVTLGTNGYALGSGDEMDAAITVTPGTQLGMLTSTVTVSSNSTMDPMLSANLTANSTTAVVGLTPGSGTLDFGSYDLQHSTAITDNIVIANTGAAELDIVSVTPTLGSGYSIVGDVAQEVAAGSSATIAVTYQPTAEGTDTGSVVVMLHGALVANNELMSETINITGTAVDRHISVPTTGSRSRRPIAIPARRRRRCRS